MMHFSGLGNPKELLKVREEIEAEHGVKVRCTWWPCHVLD
jgi:hypothetical protein